MQADVLNRLAEVTGHPYALNQGDIEGALKYYRQALGIFQSLLNKREDKIAAEVDITNTQRKVAEIIAYQGDIAGGLKMMAEKRLHMEKVFADTPLEYRLPMLILYTVEAHGNFHAGDLNKAEILIEKAWKIAYANTQANPKYHLILAFLHEETGHLALLNKRYDNAKQEYLAVISKYQGNDLWQHKRRIARAHNGLACIALQRGDSTTALHHFQQILLAFKELNTKYPNVKSIQEKIVLLRSLHEKLNNNQLTVTTLSESLHCNNPLEFMIPPAKTIN